MWTAGDGGTLRLFSQPAEGRNAEQIATALIDNGFPDSQRSYTLPNATVGYQRGYGEVVDFQPMVGSNQSNPLRVIVLAAVKNDLALIAVAAGPFREFTPPSGRDRRHRPTCRSPDMGIRQQLLSGGATRRAESPGLPPLCLHRDRAQIENSAGIAICRRSR